MIRSILEFALLAVLAQDITAPKPASIRGTVVEWGTTTGVSQAIVELRDTDNLGGPPAAITATTDEGEFTIQNVVPASYQIMVTRPGFAQASYGQKRPNGPGLPLKLAADQHVTELKISMARGGDVSGRITDRNGQPVPFASVQALSSILQRPVQAAITNDLGEYRLYWLPPGAYYVTARANDQQTFGRTIVVNPDGSDTSTPVFSATLRATASVPRALGLDEGESNIPVYYPGVPDVKSAAIIHVGSGDDIRNVNIKVVPVHTQRVRGVVMDSGNGQPVTAIIRVALTTVDTNSPSSHVLQFNPNKGQFEFSGVLPGPYQVRATVGNQVGLVVVDVLDRDVDVSIRLVDPIDVTGRIRIDSADSNAAPVNLGGLRVDIHGFQAIGSPGRVSGSGEFTMSGVSADDYQVDIGPIMPPYTGALPPAVPADLQNAYVKSIRVGDVDVLNAPLHVDGSTVGRIEVVIGMNGGLLSGSVINDKREPVPNATVVLIPRVNPLNRRDRIKSATTDDKGQFQFRAITPGEYGAIAWEDVDKNAWLDANFTRQYESSATTLRIAEGPQPDIVLSAVPITP